jgi:hypothetical protein
VKHRVHPDYAGSINLPPATGLFAVSSPAGYCVRPVEVGEANYNVEDKEEEDEAFWRVGVVATSHLLNSSPAAR